MEEYDVLGKYQSSDEPMSLAALIQSVDEIENALLRAKANISIFQVVQKKIT